jgi:hypothetical protein
VLHLRLTRSPLPLLTVHGTLAKVRRQLGTTSGERAGDGDSGGGGGGGGGGEVALPVCLSGVVLACSPPAPSLFSRSFACKVGRCRLTPAFRR